jgi:AcrR family transcriptional regulator
MSSSNNETRRKILTACWKLMVSNIGQGVRMSDIAKAAGISRQALYLHFKTRSELMIATTQFMDEELDVGKRLKAYRNATDPVERIKAYVAAWAGHMTDIQGMARALLALSPTDEEAKEAWNERMDAIHAQCKLMTQDLSRAGRLKPPLSSKKAADLFAVAISFENWDRLRRHYGWGQKAYIDHTTAMILAALVKD